MQKQMPDRAKLLKKMEKISSCRVNDAVKLAFSDGKWPEEIDGLDLTALAELKRSASGVVEMKFIDRVGVLERLLDLTDGGESEKAAEFFQAWESTPGGGDPGGV